MRYFSENFSRVNKEVKLYEMVMQHEEQPKDILSVELDAFYGQGRTIEELTQNANIVRDDFRFYSTIAGGLIGLVIGMSLISFSLKRTRKLYDIDHAACIDCGRCFSYCPQNQIAKTE